MHSDRGRGKSSPIGKSQLQRSYVSPFFGNMNKRSYLDIGDAQSVHYRYSTAASLEIGSFVSAGDALLWRELLFVEASSGMILLRKYVPLKKNKFVTKLEQAGAGAPFESLRLRLPPSPSRLSKGWAYESRIREAGRRALSRSTWARPRWRSGL